jgi:hypothetical protein
MGPAQKEQEDQQNRIEDPKIKPCSYNHRAQNMVRWEKRQPFQQMVLGKLYIHM